MKKAWRDPAKELPKPETKATPGNFEQFTEMMGRLMKVKPEEKIKRAPPALPPLRPHPVFVLALDR